MSDRESMHTIDQETFRGGVLILAICLAVAPFLTIVGARMAFPLEEGNPLAILVMLAPGIIGLFGIGYGIWAVAVPTGNGSLRIDDHGLTLGLRGNRTVAIPWTDAASWGVVRRRWNWTTSLVVRPADEVGAETRAAAHRLWSKRYAAWVIEVMEPPPDLLADFERHAPVPRQDG